MRRLPRKLSARLPVGFATALPLLTLCVGCSDSNDDLAARGEVGVGKIVYAVREHTEVDGSGVTNIDVAGGMGQVMDYGRYVPGGRLELLDLQTGKTENILEGYTTADVSSVDVSYDATRVVFTMKRDREDKYHVYWASVTRNAAGKFDIHQLTFGPFDDQNAVWAAGERIVFTTNQPYTEMGTRADEYNHGRVVTQLATMTLTGGDADRKLCSQNLSHTVTLFPMHDGRIGFSRWEHLENINDVKLFAMNPDCTQMIALSGQHGKPGNSVVQVTESNTPNVYYGVVTERENTIQAGSLVQIDARAAGAAERFDEEKTIEEAYTLLTPSVPRSDSPSPVGRYRSPAVLPDDRLLVSWADGPVNELSEMALTPPDYGVYVLDAKKRLNQLIINHESTWELYAKPIAVRSEPPILASKQQTLDATTPAVFGSIDVRQTSLASRHGETVSGAQFDSTPLDQALTQAVKVRIIEGFSSEGAPGVTMFGLTMAEGAALLGEAKVESDGSWLAKIPPYVPVHMQPIDEFDLAIRNQTTWVQGMPGEDRVCGGCHEDRNKPNLPGGQALTMAAGRGAEDFMKPVAVRLEYPWAGANVADNPNQLQRLLDSKCVSCHNSTTNGNGPQEYYTITMAAEGTTPATEYRIPRLDLSSTPVTVTYDMDVKTWPASYVSLFYPAALEMEMDEGSTVQGKVPPKWAIPSDARGSAVIEKLNVTSSKNAATYAWPLGQAFSNPDIAGGSRSDHAKVANLTRDELVMLIRAIDMGGQYYARQNSDFQPFSADPVAPGAGYDN
jgi:hypothetical protein